MNHYVCLRFQRHLGLVRALGPVSELTNGAGPIFNGN
jgi:hypothetical protein